MIYLNRRNFSDLKEPKFIGLNMGISTPSIFTTRLIKEKGRIPFMLFRIPHALLGRIVTKFNLFS